MEMKLLTAMEMDPDGNGKIPRAKFSHSDIPTLGETERKPRPLLG